MTQSIAVKMCKAQAKKEGEKLTSDQLYNLNNIHQTQGYSGEGSFSTNKWK
jgi:hypothetical protein